MQQFQVIKSFDQIKLLADPRRLAILRQLMANPGTLTQLGEALGEHPAWVRHHVKQLELAGLVDLVETRVTSGVVEKFYRARAGGYLLQELILPENTILPSVVFSGSHDLAVELCARQLGDYINMMILPLGSLDGLFALRQGLSHLSGAHLFNPATSEYNTSFVRHIFPDRATILVTLAHREQGLMMAPGNPKQISGLADLTRPNVKFINRQRGSGTRLWLDHELHKLDISTQQIRGYDQEVRTHTECALSVQQGRADVALGLHAAAGQYELDFIPFFYERYDLIIPREQAQAIHPLLDNLQTNTFRRAVESLIGYDTTHTGEQIPL